MYVNLKLRIGVKYIVSIFTQCFMSYWLRFLSYVAIPDKLFLALIGSKSVYITNVVRQDSKLHIENITYKFRYFFETIGIDKSINLGDLSNYFEFSKLIIDYTGLDGKMIKKIICIDEQGNNYHYAGINMEKSNDISFNRITFDSK